MFEIKLDYFCDILLKESENISLVIPVLKDNAKEWYMGIHRQINQAAAK